MDYKMEFEHWFNYANIDKDLIEELNGLDNNQIKDSFYRNLEFGTGGLRGIIGSGQSGDGSLISKKDCCILTVSSKIKTNSYPQFVTLWKWIN